MTSGGNNYKDFSLNRLTKCRASFACHSGFLRATAVPAAGRYTGERVLAMAILSVRLGCHDPVPNQVQVR